MSVGPDAAYVTIVARLSHDEPCQIALFPQTTIRDADGKIIEMSRSVPGPVDLWLLETELEFDLLWATLCGATFARPLVAELAFADPSAPTLVELPGSFGPASCGGGRDELFVEPAFSLGNGTGG